MTLSLFLIQIDGRSRKEPTEKKFWERTEALENQWIEVREDCLLQRFFSKTLFNQSLFCVRIKMPSQSMLNSLEEITYLHHIAFNPLLIIRSALDLLHLTR